MKGKINHYGQLLIKRGNNMAEQLCPHCVEMTQIDGNNPNNATVYHRPCGDWCPLFGEPHEYICDNGVFVRVSMCHQVFWDFDTFVDERPKEQSCKN